MSHAKKVRRMIESLSRRGVSEWTSAPRIYRLVWNFEWEVTPPLFASFGQLFVFHSVFFGLLWGIFLILVVWLVLNAPPERVLSDAVLAGALYGLAMAIVLRCRARKYKLPAWKNFGTLCLRLDHLAPGVVIPYGMSLGGLMRIRHRHTFGRATECDVFFQNAILSGRVNFEVIYFEGDGSTMLRSTGSRFPVRHNGAPVYGLEPVELKPGDLLEPMDARTNAPAARFVVVED